MNPLLPSSDGSEMFVADSESSAIRAVSLLTGGSRACVGGDPNFAENLFQVHTTTPRKVPGNFRGDRLWWVGGTRMERNAASGRRK